jgi:hypothetical protein
MVEFDFEKMTNNEISLEMKKLEKSFEKIKLEVVKKLKELEGLDKLYIKAKNELNKRNQTVL